MIAPTVEFRTVRVDELQCLFAIINKIKLVPVDGRALAHHGHKYWKD
jgi:hypothetical protein